ncbi:ComEC/Rec2 family competence protein [Gynurincola endophyticus]|uniref:ComEC/Rec2 family competence protein n=1 Tax=Gynurincola endophyticus TaxID=2479004 RepID=UPI000F8EECE6|nr:hypothetical protein [Gynurincola endophyticus]
MIFEILNINVGQADAQIVTVCQDNIIRRVLIDCGKTIAHGDKIATLIFSQKIDILIITHADLDHWGGLKSTNLLTILKEQKVIIICVNAGEKKYHANNIIWKTLMKESAIDTYYERGIKLTNNCFLSFHAANDDISNIKKLVHWKPKVALGELRDTAKNLSSIACLFVVHDDHHKELFTYYTAGDLPSKHEDQLVGDDVFKIDVMKLSHHGSRGSTSLKFVNGTIPALAYISHGNGHGHPNIEPLYNLVHNNKNNYVSIIQTNCITKGAVKDKTPYFTPAFNMNNGDITTTLEIDKNVNKVLTIQKNAAQKLSVYSKGSDRFESYSILEAHKGCLDPILFSHLKTIKSPTLDDIENLIITELTAYVMGCDLAIENIEKLNPEESIKIEINAYRNLRKSLMTKKVTYEDYLKCGDLLEHFEEYIESKEDSIIKTY